MAADQARLVYLEAYYPRTSPAFLIGSLVLFAAATGLFAFGLGRAFWPVTLILLLVTLYLAAVSIRQWRGVMLAIRVTDRAIYHAGWEKGLFRKGVPGGTIPLEAVGGVELVNLRSPAAAGPVVAIWLADPELWRGRGFGRWAREMSNTGDLAIACDETDQTAEQVKSAIDAALAYLLAASVAR